jgi:hypothetical protein
VVINQPTLSTETPGDSPSGLQNWRHYSGQHRSKSLHDSTGLSMIGRKTIMIVSLTMNGRYGNVIGVGDA